MLIEDLWFSHYIGPRGRRVIHYMKGDYNMIVATNFPKPNPCISKWDDHYVSKNSLKIQKKSHKIQ